MSRSGQYATQVLRHLAFDTDPGRSVALAFGMSGTRLSQSVERVIARLIHSGDIGFGAISSFWRCAGIAATRCRVGMCEICWLSEALRSTPRPATAGYASLAPKFASGPSPGIIRGEECSGMQMKPMSAS
jgi:hypothetical protein